MMSSYCYHPPPPLQLLQCSLNFFPAFYWDLYNKTKNICSIIPIFRPWLTTFGVIPNIKYREREKEQWWTNKRVSNEGKRRENVDGEKVCTTEEKFLKNSVLSFQLFTYQNDIFKIIVMVSAASIFVAGKWQR